MTSSTTSSSRSPSTHTATRDWSFLQAFEDGVQFPFAATIAGTPGVVTKVDFDGDERRGLVAVLQRNVESYTVSLLDIAAPNTHDVVRLLAAYKRWLGMT